MPHSTRSEYDAAAGAFDQRWATYNRRSLDLLHPFLADFSPGRLLDEGCGTGNLLAALQRWGVHVATYTGVDLSAGMLRVAVRKHGTGATERWACADAASLPFAAGSFDTVVSASSLHDWPEPRAALAAMHGALARGGRLLLLDWCADFLSIRLVRSWLQLRRRPVHEVYKRARVAGLLTEAGFRVRTISCHRISPIWGLWVADAYAC